MIGLLELVDERLVDEEELVDEKELEVGVGREEDVLEDDVLVGVGRVVREVEGLGGRGGRGTPPVTGVSTVLLSQ